MTGVHRSLFVVHLTLVLYVVLSSSASQFQPRTILHYDAQSQADVFSSAVLDPHTGTAGRWKFRLWKLREFPESHDVFSDPRFWYFR